MYDHHSGRAGSDEHRSPHGTGPGGSPRGAAGQAAEGSAAASLARAVLHAVGLYTGDSSLAGGSVPDGTPVGPKAALYGLTKLLDSLQRDLNETDPDVRLDAELALPDLETANKAYAELMADE